MHLGIAADDLAACVACGLCLPHCPTYRVTGEEGLSPRRRTAGMRQAQWEGASPDPSFVRSMATCVQCRGCETACPSGVPFGRLIEPTRATLAEGPPGAAETAARSASGRWPRWRTARPLARPAWPLRLALRSLGRHRLVLAGRSLLGVAQRLRLVPDRLARRLGVPARLPVRRPRLRGSGTDVWLFTGCVMDAWMRDVHADVQRVVEAVGAGVALPDPGAACCGALDLHAGLASGQTSDAGIHVGLGHATSHPRGMTTTRAETTGTRGNHSRRRTLEAMTCGPRTSLPREFANARHCLGAPGRRGRAPPGVVSRAAVSGRGPDGPPRGRW